MWNHQPDFVLFGKERCTWNIYISHYTRWFKSSDPTRKVMWSKPVAHDMNQEILLGWYRDPYNLKCGLYEIVSLKWPNMKSSPSKWLGLSSPRYSIHNWSGFIWSLLRCLNSQSCLPTFPKAGTACNVSSKSLLSSSNFNLLGRSWGGFRGFPVQKRLRSCVILAAMFGLDLRGVFKGVHSGKLTWQWEIHPLKM